MSRPTPLPEDAGCAFVFPAPAPVLRFLAALLFPEERLPDPEGAFDLLPVFFFLAAIYFPHKSVIVFSGLRKMHKTREDILPAFMSFNLGRYASYGPSDREREIQCDDDRSDQKIVIGELCEAPCSYVAEKALDEQDTDEQ